MAVEKETGSVAAGPVTFSVHYVDQDGRRDSANRQPDQGVSIRVRAGDEANPFLRFDCFDRHPTYTYGNAEDSEPVRMVPTTAGNTVAWSLNQLESHLPKMARRVGLESLACELETPGAQSQISKSVAQVGELARGTALKWRRTVTHNGSAELQDIPGAEVIEAGNIRFGLEFRELPSIDARGMAIHVLSDVAGQEIELLAFDCFDKNAHYHYGPRNKDMRHYWDRTLVPDPLRWVLDRLAEGKLPQMLERAGYPGVAADLDNVLIAQKLSEEVEPKALALQKANL
ncbi:MAG: hypothetical protein AAF493_13770 [Pseudomonadota bacterium]